MDNFFLLFSAFEFSYFTNDIWNLLKVFIWNNYSIFYGFEPCFILGMACGSQISASLDLGCEKLFDLMTFMASCMHNYRVNKTLFTFFFCTVFIKRFLNSMNKLFYCLWTLFMLECLNCTEESKIQNTRICWIW